MPQPKIAPYGSWKSPITADLIVAELRRPVATRPHLKRPQAGAQWSCSSPRLSLIIIVGTVTTAAREEGGEQTCHVPCLPDMDPGTSLFATRAVEGALCK